MKKLRQVVCWLTVTISSLLITIFLVYFQIDGMVVNQIAINGVISRHGESVYMARVLGPWVCHLLQTWMPLSTAITLIGTICLASSASLWIMFGMRRERVGLGAGLALCSCALFALCSLTEDKHTYILPWDWISVLAMTMLSISLTERNISNLFLIAFAIQLFNRESVMYIAVFPILAGVLDSHPADKQKIMLGMFLGILASCTILVLRLTSQGSGGQYFTLARNLSYMVDPNWYGRYFILIAIVAIIIFLRWAWSSLLWPRTTASIITLITGATFSFGMIDEYRVWIDLMPIIVLLIASTQLNRVKQYVNKASASTIIGAID